MNRAQPAPVRPLVFPTSSDTPRPPLGGVATEPPRLATLHLPWAGDYRYAIRLMDTGGRVVFARLLDDLPPSAADRRHPTPAPGTAAALLAELGLAPADVAALASRRRTVPTFADYIAQLNAMMPRTRSSENYRRCWRRLITDGGFGPRRLDEPTATEFKAFITEARANRVRRRNGRDGSAVELAWITALRKLYQYAEDDGLIEPHHNPARRLKRPRSQPPARHALPARVMAEINRIAAVTGSDPELDVLIIRLHTETACRRGAALLLRPRDLDPEDCMVLLREKGGVQRWHPVSPTLMRALVHHAHTRCNDPELQLLRMKTGLAVRDDRYARLFGRLARYIPEAEAYNITAHWLRHTTLTWVERNFGYSVARAGHGHG